MTATVLQFPYRRLKSAAPRSAADSASTSAVSAIGRSDGVKRTAGESAGPFGTIVTVHADGSVEHGAGRSTDTLRALRPYTSDAIELRCDALGLAVYLRWDEGDLGQLARDLFGDVAGDVVLTSRLLWMRVFDHMDIRPRVTRVVGSDPEVLARVLRSILQRTYVRIAQCHDLSTYPPDWFTLRSSDPLLVQDVFMAGGAPADAGGA